MTTPLLIVGGLTLLVPISILVGRSLAESRRQAWRRIAAERRRIYEHSRGLREDGFHPRCADCPFRDYRFPARTTSTPLDCTDPEVLSGGAEDWNC